MQPFLNRSTTTPAPISGSGSGSGPSSSSSSSSSFAPSTPSPLARRVNALASSSSSSSSASNPSTPSRSNTAPGPIAPATVPRSIRTDGDEVGIGRAGSSSRGGNGEGSGSRVESVGAGLSMDGTRDAVRAYEEKRDRLSKAINSTTYLLADLRNFNENEWVVRYPFLTPSPRPSVPSNSTNAIEQTTTPSAGALAPSTTTTGIVPPTATSSAAASIADVPAGVIREEASAAAAAASTFPRVRPNVRRMQMSFVDAPGEIREVSIETMRDGGEEGGAGTDDVGRDGNRVGPAGTMSFVAGHRQTASLGRRSGLGMKRSLTVLPGAQGSSLSQSGSTTGITSASTTTTTTTTPAFLPTATGEEDDSDMSGFSILRLDLNMGASRQTHLTNTTTTLISSLEKSSISRLISARLESSLHHLANLHKRVMSKNSRVLVTGDLNAGKSTFVNALLRRGEVDEEDGWLGGVMPVDQQPLTGRFVEVFGEMDDEAKGTNGKGKGREEVHVVKKGKDEDSYDKDNEDTFDSKSLDDLEALVRDEGEAEAPPVKVYLRQPSEDLQNPSILHNGILDISLIDAPGLNRDVIPTTSVFTKSPTIDVIIFVVSAANHFTLSAKEFILSAGQEKARMFIVVNRFDEVRDKERCKKAVLEQIKHLSPATYEEREELVHFVDSAQVAMRCSEGSADVGDAVTEGKKHSQGEEQLDKAFADLERSLRSFVLINRAKSKLGPAENYLTHLLADVELLVSANAVVARSERDRAVEEIERVKPELDGMRKGKDGLEEALDSTEERIGRLTGDLARNGLQRAILQVGQGQLGASAARFSLPNYPGLLGVWDYAAEVRKALIRSIELAVYEAEENTKRLTVGGVEDVAAVGLRYLPSDITPSQRVFNPEAMFAATRSKVDVKGKGRQPGNRNPMGLGLGLAARSDLLQVSVSDILDIHHYVTSLTSAFIASDSTALTKSGGGNAEVSMLGYLSLAAGALTMVGGKTIGAKALVDSVFSLSDLLGNPNHRKWAGPVAGAAILGLTGYILYDLPRTIPQNIGRSMQAALTAATTGQDGMSFAEIESTRMQRESRKVIRLASWDLRERFHDALDSRYQIVMQNEELKRNSSRALEWFDSVQTRVDTVREEMGKTIA